MRWLLPLYVVLCSGTCTGVYNASSQCLSSMSTCASGVTGSTGADACGLLTAQVTCYSETRNSNCSVDESVVTFSNLLPVFSGVCYQLSNYTSQCFDFLMCTLSTDYSNMTSAMTSSTAISPSLVTSVTSTAFWCQYVRQTISCFQANNVSCQMAPQDQAVISSQWSWIQETCSGNANNVSSTCKKSVNSCLQDSHGVIGTNCEAQRQELECLAGRGKTCAVNESLVPFSKLYDSFSDICSVITGYVSDCAKLRECLATTDYTQMPGLGTAEGPPTSVYGYLLSTHFWCRYLTQASNCVILTATTCDIPISVENSLTKVKDRLVKSCYGDTGNIGALNSYASRLCSISLWIYFVSAAFANRLLLLSVM